MQMSGGNDETRERREDHERHHPRLQQREIITDRRLGDVRQLGGVVIDDRQDAGLSTRKRRAALSRRGLAYLIFGSTSNWWNGGGDVSVHSSVVAPAPHGLFAAASLRMNEVITLNRKISTPKAEM